MANTLNKIGITTGNTVEAYHVTQSIDAFTSTEAYDISLSGSFNMTGSINGQPLIINPLTASYAMTASYALSASYAVSSSHEIIKEVSSSHANFADTASLAYTASYVSLTAGPNITINQSGTTFEISGSGGGGGITPSETGSFYLSSSVSIGTITFTQGDGTTESVTLTPTGSNLVVLPTYTNVASSQLNQLPYPNSLVINEYSLTAYAEYILPTSSLAIGNTVKIIDNKSGTSKTRVRCGSNTILKFSDWGNTSTAGYMDTNNASNASMELTVVTASAASTIWRVTSWFNYDGSYIDNNPIMN